VRADEQVATDWQTARIEWEEALGRWVEAAVVPYLERAPERREGFTTPSGLPVERLYTPGHHEETIEEHGWPGRFPFTRGPYPTMYRARPWTMRQIAGYGGPKDTNERLRYLIANGQTGISIDFDMPTLMGLDSDHERSFGEVGREGVAIDHLDDLHELFEGIDIGEISVSMTINPSAWILLAKYIVVAEERGIALDRLSGTTQADIIKEFVAQKEWIYPVEPSLRLVRDMIVHAAAELPRWNAVNVSGYHIREAGSTAVQEVAFTLAAAITYAERVIAAGVPFDDFAPRLSFYFVAQNDLLEEVAKFRAARRLWARIARDRFGASREESMRLRFHCQTAGSALTALQPLNNIVRGSIQALAAVFGGAQSLHVSGMDEALAIPSELAMKIALRTQQIVLEESGVASTIDPLGGSHAIESLTDAIEAGAVTYLDEIEEQGGTVACVESGYFQQEIANAAYEYQLARDAGRHVVVGVNAHREPAGDLPFEIHRVDPEFERQKIEALREYKRRREPAEVERRLAEVRRVAETDENIMPATIAAVRARATEGEIVETLRPVFGTYVETAVF
jgi:methylmalonyl-CoA mutase cobalamin-binding domain/chain